MHGTIIRMKTLSPTIIAFVLTVGSHDGFVAYTQTYNLLPNGSTGARINSHPWASEKPAIAEFDAMK